jgi:hypothetical protein
MSWIPHTVWNINAKEKFVIVFNYSAPLTAFRRTGKKRFLFPRLSSTASTNILWTTTRIQEEGETSPNCRSACWLWPGPRCRVGKNPAQWFFFVKK